MCSALCRSCRFRISQDETFTGEPGPESKPNPNTSTYNDRQQDDLVDNERLSMMRGEDEDYHSGDEDFCVGGVGDQKSI